MRYDETIKRLSSEGIVYLQNPIYPEYPENEDDLYVVTVDGDRFDKLSLQFYGRADYWWIIAAVNSTEHADSIVVKPGVQLRIPADPEAYILLYNPTNS